MGQIWKKKLTETFKDQNRPIKVLHVTGGNYIIYKW